MSPIPAASAPEASSLINRIRHLRALLLRLTKLGPGYARRLAPELLILHRLLNELLPAQTSVNAPTYPALPIMAANGVVAPIPAAGVWGTLARASAQAPGMNGYVPEAAGAQGRDHQPGSGVSPPDEDASKSPAGATSAAPQLPALLMDLTVSTGPSRSATAPGGASSGTAAGTLATLCAFCLFLGLLSGRLTLIVPPWRLAVLGHRLERPG